MRVSVISCVSSFGRHALPGIVVGALRKSNPHIRHYTNPTEPHSLAVPRSAAVSMAASAPESGSVSAHDAQILRKSLQLTLADLFRSTQFFAMPTNTTAPTCVPAAGGQSDADTILREGSGRPRARGPGSACC